MSKKCILTLVCASMIGGVAYAVDTSLTIDSATSVKNGPNYDCTGKGTITLGTNDTYTSHKFYFIDPNSNDKAAFIMFTPPAAGKTESYSAFLTTQTTGKWKFYASFQYKDKDGVAASIAKTKEFEVK